jgi:hypothetical protein
MKLTNKYGLPQIIVNVVERPTYSKGNANISATQLLNSPKIVALTKLHEEELEQDVSQMLWSIMGSAMHGLLEHGKEENSVVEQRLHAEVEGWLLSGAVDLQEVHDDGIDIFDYKMTSVWSAMNDKPEWEQQLNIYAWLIERNKKVPIKSINIVAFLRDWTERESKVKENYPPAAMVKIPINLWTYAEREEYVKGRIAKHAEAEYAIETGGSLADCTPKEMWEKKTTYAVKKIGGVRAKYVFEDLDTAQSSLEELGKDYEIEVRPGERTRCNSFCQVSKWCQQYQDYLKEQSNGGK